MTSKTPTALEEIQGRVELLGKQVESAKEEAKTFRDLADGHEKRAAELTELRGGYLAILSEPHDRRECTRCHLDQSMREATP